MLPQLCSWVGAHWALLTLNKLSRASQPGLILYSDMVIATPTSRRGAADIWSIDPQRHCKLQRLLVTVPYRKPLTRTVHVHGEEIHDRLQFTYQ